MNEFTCQCPDDRIAFMEIQCGPQELKARTHRANACPGDYNVQLYERDGVELWLCSCCCFFSDKKLSRSEIEIV